MKANFKVSQDRIKTISMIHEQLYKEKERRRIATELHGSIGQNLSLAIIKCQELKSKISSEDSLTVIEYICDMLEQSLENTRLLALEISPPVLYEIGLEAAVSWLLEQFKDKHGLQYIFEDDKKQKSLDNNILVWGAWEAACTLNPGMVKEHE